MKSKINNTIKYTFVFIILLLFFYNCKTKTINYHLIDNSTKPTIKELSKKYYKYDSFITIENNQNRIFPTIYTNVKPQNDNPKFPRNFFSISHANKSDLKYFNEEINGEYILYYENNSRLIMREYGKYYRLTSDTTDYKINSLEKFYNYLNKNNIKYKLIYEKNNESFSKAKIYLTKNKVYTYITISPYSIITMMYYQPKDTTSRYNYGMGRFFFAF